jgi:hypothetical protein
MSKNVVIFLFIGSMTLVSGADYATLSAKDLQNMSTKERVAYINNFKEEIALMSLDNRREALNKMRIKMRLEHLPGQSKRYVQQMQVTTSGDMNMMQNMFQLQLKHIKQVTTSTSKTITNLLPSVL